MEIKVISQNGCSPCQMVKAYLNNENVEYMDINISNDPKAVDKYGIMSTPVTILVDEDEEIARVNGFNTSELDALIEQL